LKIKVLALLFSVAAAAQGPPPPISHIKGNLYRGNAGLHNVFLVTPDGIILVDPISTPFATALKPLLAERFHVPVRYVVYSHGHYDHIEGGSVFADTAQFVAHENVRRAMDGRLPQFPGGIWDANRNSRIEFEEAKFIARVDALVKKHGYCTVVVSEGAHRADGSFLAEQGTRDAFGHAQLGGAAPVVANMVKTALGHKFHWAVADYLQRAARHIASKTDVRQAYELGKRAVELALKGQNAVMPTIERTSDVPYRYRIGVADLADVANVEKFMPRDFISADGFSITEKCRRYLRPLIAGEDYPAYRGGLPVYATLKNVPVAPRLAPFALQ